MPTPSCGQPCDDGLRVSGCGALIRPLGAPTLENHVRNAPRMKRLYVTTAIVVFSLLVIAVALNIMAIGVSFVRASLRTANPVAQRYGDERLAKVYPGKTPQEINDLLSETWSRPFIYETFT